jgi:predicted Zn-dependent peptidase
MRKRSIGQQPPASTPAPFMFRKFKHVPNGLRVILIEDHALPLSPCAVVNVGSLNDPVGRKGFSLLT